MSLVSTWATAPCWLLFSLNRNSYCIEQSSIKNLLPKNRVASATFFEFFFQCHAVLLRLPRCPLHPACSSLLGSFVCLFIYYLLKQCWLNVTHQGLCKEYKNKQDNINCPKGNCSLREYTNAGFTSFAS